MAKKREKPYDLKLSEDKMPEIERLSNLGLRPVQIGDRLGLTPGEWYKECSHNPEIEKRIRIGKSTGLEFGLIKLRQKIEEGCHHSLKFYLQCRHKWGEETTLKLKTDKKHPVELKITTTDPVEAGKIYEQIMTTGS